MTTQQQQLLVNPYSMLLVIKKAHLWEHSKAIVLERLLFRML